MLFHTFENREQRRACGGSAFVEIQFCRLPYGTSVKEIVLVDSIKDFEVVKKRSEELRFFKIQILFPLPRYGRLFARYPLDFLRNLLRPSRAVCR